MSSYHRLLSLYIRVIVVFTVYSISQEFQQSVRGQSAVMNS